MRAKKEWARTGDVRVCVRSSKQKGMALEIRELILIVKTGISAYVFMTLVCICYFDNNIMLPVTEGYWRSSLRDTEDSPSLCFLRTYVRTYYIYWTCCAVLSCIQDTTCCGWFFTIRVVVLCGATKDGMCTCTQQFRNNLLLHTASMNGPINMYVRCLL